MSGITLSLLVICALLCLASTKHIKVKQHTGCEHKSTSFSCPSGTLIKIRKVFYGRVDKTTCKTKNMFHFNCKLKGADKAVRKQCEGKSSCSFAVSNSFFGGDPCKRTNKYTKINYVCAKKHSSKIFTHTGCEHKHTTMKCPSGHQIKIVKTFYGRMNKSTCKTPHMYHTKCKLNKVSHSVNKLCNGKSSCSFKVTNALLGGDPCKKTNKYATFRYRCLKKRVPAKIYTHTGCEHKHTTMKCPSDKKMKIIKTFYGRMNKSTCKTHHMYHTRCKLHKVSHSVNKLCNGKSSCSFKVTNALLGGDPCKKTNKYATFRYRCL